MLHELTGDTIQGQDLSLEQALHLYTSPEIKLPQLIAAAARVTEHFHEAGRVELCAIVSARSGSCSEDCAFCAQSARYQTGAPVYPLLTPQEILQKAQQAAQDGATRFSIVTSGRGIGPSDLDQVLRAIELIRSHTNLAVCASLGIIDYRQAKALREAGLSMYHHNLETCRAFYSRICTTHSWEQRVATIHAARQAGLKVCAGGIIGLGESPRQRLELAAELRQLGITSVPLNFLTPIPGTPLAGHQPPPPAELVRLVAVWRLMLPRAVLRLCGGRRTGLRRLVPLAILAGANGLMVGHYLTTPGEDVAADRQMLQDLNLG
ncbi:MAG: biotin synthase BioB [Desulfurispora sp.]|uniref:biotin synthase BioB n=1 Tax=Desulfurispora sp. TaxID=3014275 RepID=UPI00404B97EC